MAPETGPSTAAPITEEDDFAWAEHTLVILLAGRAAQRLALRGSEAGWRRMRRRLELTAFHEAGHGVVAAACGRTVYELTIVPDPFCEMGKNLMSGGSCREGLSLIDPKPPSEATLATKTTGETDSYRIARMGVMCFAGGVSPKWKLALKVIRQFRKRTEGLLEANWPWVQKLAEELERRKTLNQSEIAAILSRA
jgi:hypothetical protein